MTTMQAFYIEHMMNTLKLSDEDLNLEIANLGISSHWRFLTSEEAAMVAGFLLLQIGEISSTRTENKNARSTRRKS